MQNLAFRLENTIWSKAEPRSYGGIDFDLVAERKVAILNGVVFIKEVPVLDAKTARKWNEYLHRLNEEQAGHLKSGVFVLCLISSNVDSKIVKTIGVTKKNNLQSFAEGSVRFITNKGHVLIADTMKKTVHCDIPKTPLDINRMMTSTKRCIEDSFIDARFSAS